MGLPWTLRAISDRQWLNPGVSSCSQYRLLPGVSPELMNRQLWLQDYPVVQAEWRLWAVASGETAGWPYLWWEGWRVGKPMYVLWQSLRDREWTFACLFFCSFLFIFEPHHDLIPGPGLEVGSWVGSERPIP